MARLKSQRSTLTLAEVVGLLPDEFLTPRLLTWPGEPDRVDTPASLRAYVVALEDWMDQHDARAPVYDVLNALGLAPSVWFMEGARA